MARSRSRSRPTPDAPPLPPLAGLRPTIPPERDGVPLLRMQTLGASRLQLGTLQLGMPSGLLFALVLRLVYTPGMAVPREQLLRELWPAYGDVRRRGNLRQALYKLRSMGLQVALVGTVVHLDRGQVAPTFTVERTAALFDRDVIRGAEPFGAFVPGFVAPSAELAEWLDATRESVHADVRRILVEQLRQRRERADWGGAEVLSRWLLQFDPLNEDATLTLAECTMLSGAKVEAVAILDRYLAELGPYAGDIRLPATQLRKRFTEPTARRRPSLASTERHFVGRQSELAALTLSMRRARWHDGSAVLLHGPPGIGKTRLVTELGKVAQIEGYREVSLECRESDQLRPLGPFLEVLPELMASPGALGCSPESMAVLRRLVGEAVVAPEAGSGAEERGAEVVGDAEMDARLRSIRAHSIRHAIIDLVAAVSDEKPVYMIVEDAHWLDTHSWELLIDLIQRLRSLRVFTLLTSRYSSIRQERPEKIPFSLSIRRLSPLTADECRDLTRAIGSDLTASVPIEVEDWIIDACEGAPLMLRALLEHWAVTGDAGGVPPTLISLLEHRLDRLTPTAVRALQSAELLGRFASLERIRSVLQLPTHELLLALEQLESADCLASSNSALVLTHHLVAQVATDRLSDLVDAALRDSITEMFYAEFNVTGDTSLLIEVLRHLHVSEQFERLAMLLVKHADVLVSSGRPQAVLAVAADVQLSTPTVAVSRQVARVVARLETETGAFERALRASPGGFIDSSDPADLSETEIDERLSFIEAAYRSDPILDRGELGVSAAAIARNREIKKEIRLRAADIGLVIAANTCDSKLADECFRGLDLSSTDLKSSDLARRLGILYHAPFGSIVTATELAEESYEHARVAAPSTGAIADLGRSGFVFRMLGINAAAAAAFGRARAMAHEIGSPRLAEYPVWQLAQLALEQGDSDSACRLTEELQRLSARGAGTTAHSYVDGHLCLMAISSGDRRAAKSYLAQCIKSLPKVAPLRSLAYTMALELAVNTSDKAWKPDSTYLDVATQRFRATQKLCAADLLAAGMATALIRVGRTDEAREALRAYLLDSRREVCAPAARLATVLKQLDLTT
jgi:DNA-binding SARP family transcriptional activator